MTGTAITKGCLVSRRLSAAFPLIPFCTDYLGGNDREAFVGTPLEFDLVQERHVGHRAALALGVHDHSMPERQRNGCVIRMGNGSTGVTSRFSIHDPPAPSRGAGVVQQQGPILRRSETVRESLADIDRLTTAAVELFHNVWFACAAEERFVMKDKVLVDHERWFGQEEPLALTAKGAVLARVALAG